MRLRQRIFIILAVGSFLVLFEILGFHQLNREIDNLAHGLEPTFQSLTNAVQAATVVSNLVKIVVPQAQTVPQQIWPKWVVNREIPTTTVSCWGEAEAKTLLATEIEYSAELFRWKDVLTRNPVAETRIVSAEQLHEARFPQFASYVSSTRHQRKTSHADYDSPSASNDLLGRPSKFLETKSWSKTKTP